MKKIELKKLSNEFTYFMINISEVKDIELLMSEFWKAKFCCNNSKRESELLDFWESN